MASKDINFCIYNRCNTFLPINDDLDQKQSSKTKICGEFEVQSFVSMFSKVFVTVQTP